METGHNDDELPASSGSSIDRIFWWGYKFLPKWLLPEGKFATKVVDLLWVDCMYCAIMRGAFLGVLSGWLAGFATGLLF